jgi:hypothetical protein
LEEGAGLCVAFELVRMWLIVWLDVLF